jgi:hypothetical protein
LILNSISERFHFALAMSRLLFSRGAWPTAHVCELLASAHFSGLPGVNLTEVTRGECSPALHPALIGSGSGSMAEVVALSAVTAALRPQSILEFGTHDGFSGWHLWANSQAQILTLDLPRAARPFLPKDPRVRCLEVDTRQWEPAPGERFDLCFIDAGHDESCVRNDSEKAFRCLRPGGTILWHDAVWRRYDFAVNRYLHELRASGKDVRLLRTGFYDYCALAILQTKPEQG